MQKRSKVYSTIDLKTCQNLEIILPKGDNSVYIKILRQFVSLLTSVVQKVNYRALIFPRQMLENFGVWFIQLTMDIGVFQRYLNQLLLKLDCQPISAVTQVRFRLLQFYHKLTIAALAQNFTDYFTKFHRPLQLQHIILSIISQDFIDHCSSSK